MTALAYKEQYHLKERADVMNNKVSQENQGNYGSTSCTFEINVRFTQNATWQGQIYWFEQKKKQSFRSALEMLKLMDEALSEETEVAYPVGWEGTRV